MCALRAAALFPWDVAPGPELYEKEIEEFASSRMLPRRLAR
jgi:hypothetical protein